MKSQFVILMNRLNSYNWITKVHFKKHGSFFALGLEKDQRRRNWDEKLSVKVSATGKEKKQLAHKAKKLMDNWREESLPLSSSSPKFQADINCRLGAVKKEMVHLKS